MSQTHKKCGYITIVGRPNVGKSTLLNQLIQQKISITSRKPQTTRQCISGIRTFENYQLIYVDTPGLHQSAARALNRHMNRSATNMLFDVDLILFVVDSLHWVENDEWALKKLTHTTAPVILLINKIDKITTKEKLLTHIDTLSKKRNFTHIIPLCAKSPQDVKKLEDLILTYLPKKPFVFPAGKITDCSDRFLAAEIIREKLIRGLTQELPYDLMVEIEEYRLEKKGNKSLLRISAVIYVERPGQKKIVIGEGGSRLKSVGEKARKDMEKLFGNKIFLRLWIKVKKGWADDPKRIQTQQ